MTFTHISFRYLRMTYRLHHACNKEFLLYIRPMETQLVCSAQQKNNLLLPVHFKSLFPL